jgi:hypothetical protein
MNDLQLSPPAKLPLQHSALDVEPVSRKAEPSKPVEPTDDVDKYDISRLACTE